MIENGSHVLRIISTLNPESAILVFDAFLGEYDERPRTLTVIECLLALILLVLRHPNSFIEVAIDKKFGAPTITHDGVISSSTATPATGTTC
jgi:hypothetical protein